MRSIVIAPSEYYHLYNRGVNKQSIFSEERDMTRFLFLILYLQSSKRIDNLGRKATDFFKTLSCDIETKEVAKNRNVELSGFCLMPNHFHLIVKEVEEGGIASYMQRVLNAYTKYWNIKYEKSGHLFQGPYKAVHISDDRQLLHLSAYIHRNPRDLAKWYDKERFYKWSSYQDCTDKNRWGSLLETSVYTDQFKDEKAYLDFLNTSSAKLLEEELSKEICLE